MNLRDFKAKYVERRALMMRGRHWSSAMVNAFVGASSFAMNLSPFLRWTGVAFLVWAAYEAWQAIRTREGVAEVKWWVLGFGLAAFLHVPDYLMRAFILWDWGVDVNDYYSPHLDAFAKNEAIFGLGLILLGVAMFAFEAKRSQPYLPNIPTIRLRWQSFRSRWSLAAVGMLISLTLVLTVFNTYFNTYKAHFYQKESLRLYARANPIDEDRPQIRFTEQLIAFNSGTTTVAVVGLRIETWTEVNPHPPPNQTVSHFGQPVSNSARAFVLRPGDASEPLNLDVAIDGPKYYGGSAPIPGSSDRILTLQLVVQTVSADTHMLRLFEYPFMRLRFDPSGNVGGLIEVGFSPELSSETPRDIHWDEKIKMLDRPHPN